VVVLCFLSLYVGEHGEHGTFKDVEALLPRIAELGFDVLYLPPVHPIGTSFVKGKTIYDLSTGNQAFPTELGLSSVAYRRSSGIGEL
jgi:glycosidase